MPQAKPLTARQKQVLAQYIAGETYTQIAQRLNLSPHTVRRHIEQIYKRAGLETNNKFALRIAYERKGIGGN